MRGGAARLVLSAALSAVLLSCTTALGDGSNGWHRSHGLGLYGPQDLKYPDGVPYEHVNTNAPKGGILNLASPVFTKFNFYTIEGMAAPGQELCFEPLAEASMDDDEPASWYGRLADWFELADDRLSMKAHVNPLARFSDGEPVTADDVVFTFGLLKEPAFSPMWKMALEELESAAKLDEHTVLFKFKKLNREIPTWVAGMMILPRHIYGTQGKDFGKDFDEVVPVGSGPCVVESFDKSSYILYRRDPGWWGAGMPRCQGRYNFDKVKYHLYIEVDGVAYRQALKNGSIDVSDVSSSKDWQFEYNGENFRKNYGVRRAFPHKRVASMQCFAFNLRRPKFQDIRVRKALASVFDFEFMSKNLFYDQYTRSVNYWDNSAEMTDRGPAQGEVRRILLELRGKHNKDGRVFVPRDAITRGPYLVGADSTGAMLPMAERIQAANAYLDTIGWRFDPEKKVRCKDDMEMSFDILLVGPGFQRVCNPYIETLREIGVNGRIQIVMPAEFTKRANGLDFDVVVGTLGGNPSPGNEQRDMWTTASADVPGSANILGVKNPALDDLVERIVAADSRRELVDATKALDRVLCANHYVIPHWYIASDRVIYWNRFGMPARYTSNAGFVVSILDHGWFDAARDAALREAMKTGAVFEGGDKSVFPKSIVAADVSAQTP